MFVLDLFYAIVLGFRNIYNTLLIVNKSKIVYWSHAVTHSTVTDSQNDCKALASTNSEGSVTNNDDADKLLLTLLVLSLGSL